MTDEDLKSELKALRAFIEFIVPAMLSVTARQNNLNDTDKALETLQSTMHLLAGKFGTDERVNAHLLQISDTVFSSARRIASGVHKGPMQ